MRHNAEIAFALATILLLMLPFWLSEPHDHTTKPLLYPNGLDTAYIEICGDTARVIGDYHKPLRDHTREWILDESVIVDKPF